ncbi:MAG TPA: Asp23/Gls24 family envelope stress response protein [Planctomycetota bacterium]|nr:Asp23/Gls24 family envelope stress response protein [Planctomycetota bacterium]HRT93693.1 Asp23/Gls24 family envelope stress response protein [Planctomycetota bacterium]
MAGTSSPLTTDLPEGGRLTISEVVLAEIAFAEAMRTPGVVTGREGILSGVLRRRRPRGIAVEASEGEVAFRISVGVREGVSIPETATTLRERVAAAVTAKTGYRVRAVNVRVDHVRLDSDS